MEASDLMYLPMVEAGGEQRLGKLGIFSVEHHDVWENVTHFSNPSSFVLHSEECVVHTSAKDAHYKPTE